MVDRAERSLANTFAGLTLDRQAERRDDEGWIAAERVSPNARIIVVDGDGRAQVDPGQTALRRLDFTAAGEWANVADATYLGRDEQGPLFVALAKPRSAADTDSGWLDLRSAGTMLPPFDAGLFAYARALTHWQSKSRYCAACGAPLILNAARHRARCSRATCGIEYFPRIDPAMIVIVSWRDACLLGRQAHWAPGRYSTLAGFVDPGESLEDAVRREVREEAGVRLGACEYHSSQPWPFPSSLMIGFTAKATDPSITLGNELSEARWFRPRDILHGLEARTLSLSPPLSVSYRLISHWMRESAGVDLADAIRRNGG